MRAGWSDWGSELSASRYSHNPAVAQSCITRRSPLRSPPPFSYGLIATYIKGWASNVPSRGLAVGTQLAAGILLVPFLPLWPPAGAPTPLVIGCMLALGLVCGAVAYVLYFRLIADIGATGALTVTYLIPVFGLLWGALFLGEAITVLTLAGAALVILGTVLVLRK